MSERSPTLKPEAADSGGAQTGGTEPKRILLVEGDGFTRLVLLLRLRLAGFGVDFTSNGTLGLGKLRSCQPDILVVELKLCGLSGLELIKAARAEPTFGNRPIYVFTQADRMSRTTRKEVGLLATEVFDKSSVTREDLVRIFAITFFNRAPAGEKTSASAGAEPPDSALSETVLSGALEELTRGVRDQSEVLAAESGARVASGSELLSRVSSLASCAKAAGLPNLARQAKALEDFLSQLCRNAQGYPDAALSTVTRAVEVMSQMSCEKTGKEQGPSQFKAVFLDEAPYSNRAVEEALLNAGFQPVCFEDAARARKYLASNRTEVIIANVVLPEAHGLALADIRQLPLHAKTPVIFAPESTVTAPVDDELPISAPRLDKAPLLLAELVLKALNGVQSTKTSAAVGPVGQRFNHLFTSAGIPSEPILRAQPGLQDVDREARLPAKLPAIPIDGTHIEERSVEALPPSVLQAEVPPPPEPEPTVEDQTAVAAWLAAAASDNGHTVAGMNTASELELDEAAAPHESTASTPNYGKVMNNQLRAVSEDYVPQGESRQPDGSMSNHHNQREDLSARVSEADAFDEVSGAEQKAQARCAELEEEVAALRQAFEGLNGPFSEQQQASAETGKQVQELEQRLSQNVAELETQREEQRRVEAELRRQLEAANAASQESEAGRQQAAARCAQLEQELKALPHPPEERPNESAQEQKVSAPESEFEQQVRQSVAALARATAELAKERGERQRNQQRAADLNGRLQVLHEDFSRTLQAQREDLARVSALEEQQRQTSQALERYTADIEQQQAERRLAEEQLQKAKELNAQLRKDLSFFEGANKKFDGSRQDLQARLEASLSAAREQEARRQQENAERQRLTESLEEARRELQNQLRGRETLAQELQTTRDALQDREAKLQNQTAERQRLNESLDSFQRDHLDGPERDLEFSKVQSALQLEQVERNRQETQLARMRQSALDAAHSARALRTNLRRQIREPVDNLIQSARSLLELEMGDAQKQLAEAVLQDVLLVQARLREPGLAQGNPPEAAAPPATTAT